MTYTRQELIAAYCAYRSCQPSDLPKIEAAIQQRINVRRAALQRQLDAIPLTAKEQMKKDALNYLNRQTNETTITDNEGVTL